MSLTVDSRYSKDVVQSLPQWARIDRSAFLLGVDSYKTFEQLLSTLVVVAHTLRNGVYEALFRLLLY